MSARKNVMHSSLPVRRASEESRRHERILLQVPLFVRGRDVHTDPFLELAKTLNISAQGALLTCQRSLALNEVITLTIPAPSLTSSALVPSGMAPILARVKRQKEAGDVHLVGVEFLKSIG